jgi:hypothetical protein
MSLTPSSNIFYISEDPPPEPILSPDMKCTIYHPLTMNGTRMEMESGLTANISKFIETHDRTESGNITELSSESFGRFFETPCFIGILLKNGEILGTMITIIMRVKIDDREFITTYTTFLCIHKDHRDSGLAMILIRSIMREGYQKYGIQHGYYMTSNTHHSVHSEIKSWYRPINIKRASAAGFTLQTFDRRGDRQSVAMRQKLAYHVSKPSPLPVLGSYYEVMDIMKKRSNGVVKDPQDLTPGPFLFGDKKGLLGKLCLDPTYQEFIWLSKCFDIYTVGDYGIFMLFPMTTYISGTGRRVRNAQVALMVGDILPQALWIANEKGYDLLYGWCSSDVTSEKVISIRGLITTAKSYLELYNTKKIINNNDMMVPIF